MFVANERIKSKKGDLLYISTITKAPKGRNYKESSKISAHKQIYLLHKKGEICEQYSIELLEFAIQNGIIHESNKVGAERTLQILKDTLKPKAEEGHQADDNSPIRGGGETGEDPPPSTAEGQDQFIVPAGSTVEKGKHLVDQLLKHLEDEISESDDEGEDEGECETTEKALAEACRSFRSQMKDESTSTRKSTVLLGFNGHGKSSLANWAAQVDPLPIIMSSLTSLALIDLTPEGTGPQRHAADPTDHLGLFVLYLILSFIWRLTTQVTEVSEDRYALNAISLSVNAKRGYDEKNGQKDDDCLREW